MKGIQKQVDIDMEIHVALLREQLFTEKYREFTVHCRILGTIKN
jgi:hypothetical protein